MQIVAADIGGSNARFALAEIANGRVVALGEPTILHTADHASLQAAWRAFGAIIGIPLPRAASIAVASPVNDGVVKLTNNVWVIDPANIDGTLGVDTHVLLNDFGAVAHAVAAADAADFMHICGPDIALPAVGTITICGPGTGFGVALLLKNGDRHQVIETEGGHIGFAPLDAIDEAVMRRLRERYTRVSIERIVSGPGLLAIYETLVQFEGRPITLSDDRAVWTAALEATDPLAVAALDRFLRALGAVSGDLALAHGAGALVIAGGLGQRLRDKFADSGFADLFIAKGRFQGAMKRFPVKLITHSQPGLFGAAVAFAQRYSEQIGGRLLPPPR